MEEVEFTTDEVSMPQIAINKRHLSKDDQVYCAGCYLKIIDKDGEQELQFVQTDGDMYYDGLMVCWDEDDGYYIEEVVSQP